MLDIRIFTSKVAVFVSSLKYEERKRERESYTARR